MFALVLRTPQPQPRPSRVSQVALVAGKADFNTMAQLFMYGHVVQCLAAFPSFEKLNVPTGAFIGTMFLLVAFPELTRLGVLKPSTMSNVAIFFYVAISFAEICTPKPVLDAFGFTESTPLTQFLMGSYSTVKVCAALLPMPSLAWPCATSPLRWVVRARSSATLTRADRSVRSSKPASLCSSAS